MSISISWFQVWDLVEDEMGNFGLELALWWILGFSLSWKWELTSCDAGLTYCVIAPKIATVSLSKVSCIVDKSSSFVSMEHTISFNCCKFLLVSTTFWKKKKTLNLEFISALVTPSWMKIFVKLVGGENFSKEVLVGSWFWYQIDVG